MKVSIEIRDHNFRKALLKGAMSMAEPPRPGQPARPPERSGTLIEGTVNLNPRQPGRPEPVERSGTVLETDDEVRRALLSGLEGRKQAVPVHTPHEGTKAHRAKSVANPFRPTARPPVAILTVYDDGKLDGEIVRIRDHRFIIGRTEGDLRIPIDGRISSRHVEITHQLVGGSHRWVVTDLQSTHGMFVRVSKTALTDKAEFLVGNGRYRLDVPQLDATTTSGPEPAGQGSGETHGWDDTRNPFRPPALTELIGNEIGNRVLLMKTEYWIGSDPSCAICRPDDPFCEPKHVRLHRGSRGWHVEHNKTRNGLWLRMPQITVESVLRFQIGEQRFCLEVP
jgi:hypothetical protein